MVSELRLHKLNYVFDTFFDVNNDGTIRRDDFELAIERIAKSRGFTKDDENYIDLSERFLHIWIHLLEAADDNHDNEISREEFVKLWGDSMCEDWKILYMEFMFQLQDTSEDGSIEFDEFSQICQVFGVSAEESKQAFQKLSRNGTAKVDFSYYSELWKDYFSSDAPEALGNCLFGKTKFV